MEAACDVIVVGSGAAGLTAASVAAAEGQRVLLVDSAPLVGGTTAISRRHGVGAGEPQDGRGRPAPTASDAARTYLRPQCAGPPTTGALRGLPVARRRGASATSKARTVAAAAAGHVATPTTTRTCRAPPPAAVCSSRCPSTPARWARHFALLRRPCPSSLLFGGMMISRADLPHLRRVARSPRSAWHVARLAGAVRPRAPARAARHHAAPGQCAGGAAAQVGAGPRVSSCALGAAVHAAADRGRRAWSGVELDERGHERARARARPVILASGGLSHDAALRSRYVPAERRRSLTTTVGRGRRHAAVPSLALDGRRATAAQQSQAAGASGSPASTVHPPRRYAGRLSAHRDRPRQARGHRRRSARDSASSTKRCRTTSSCAASCAPARARSPPGWSATVASCGSTASAAVQPFTRSTRRDASPAATSSARRTLAGLAQSARRSWRGLRRHGRRFNADARRGVDTEFGRGSRHLPAPPGRCRSRGRTPAWHRSRPAPFYAVAVQPADLGMAAGIVTDDHARALAPTGSPIPGLYACGNDMQSVMNGAYPGPGITLGPALVFGYVAARHARRRACRVAPSSWPAPRAGPRRAARSGGHAGVSAARSAPTAAGLRRAQGRRPATPPSRPSWRTTRLQLVAHHGGARRELLRRQRVQVVGARHRRRRRCAGSASARGVLPSAWIAAIGLIVAPMPSATQRHQQRQRVDLGHRVERQVDAFELQRDAAAQAVPRARQDQRQRGHLAQRQRHALGAPPAGCRPAGSRTAPRQQRLHRSGPTAALWLNSTARSSWPTRVMCSRWPLRPSTTLSRTPGYLARRCCSQRQPELAHGGGRQAQRHTPAHHRRLLPRHRHRLVQLAQHELGVVVQRLAVLGGRHAARRAHQQRLADLVFEPRHLLAQRRLRDEQLPRRLGQAAALDDLHEVPQLPHVHREPRFAISKSYSERNGFAPCVIAPSCAAAAAEACDDRRARDRRRQRRAVRRADGARGRRVGAAARGRAARVARRQFACTRATCAACTTRRRTC